MAPPAPPPLPPPPAKPSGRTSAPIPPPPSLPANPQQPSGNGISISTYTSIGDKAWESQQGQVNSIIKRKGNSSSEQFSVTAPFAERYPPAATLRNESSSATSPSALLKDIRPPAPRKESDSLPALRKESDSSSALQKESDSPSALRRKGSSHDDSPFALRKKGSSHDKPTPALRKESSSTDQSPSALRKEGSHHNSISASLLSRSSGVENPPSTSVSSGKHETLNVLLPSKDALRKQISAPVASQSVPLTPTHVPVRALSLAVAGTGDADSDYSSVGDYSDNHDFYDPSDAALEENIAAALAHEAELHQNLVNRSMSGQPKSGNVRENSDPDSDESERDEDAMEICDGDSDDEGQEGVVRQNSNFSRLSAQSWLTVDSVEDVASNAIQPSQSKDSPGTNVRTSTSSENSITIADEDNPLNELRPDAAKVLDTVKLKRLTDKSVFECCVELLCGMPTYKKKTFRRFGARRVWLSADCNNLCWNSKKDNVESDSIQLQRVAKLKCLEREVAVDVVEGYRVSLLFSTPEEAGLWTRCLSCLIPLQAKVRAPMIYLLKEKDREDFTLEDDVFNGLSLREHFQVNSYAVFGHIKGHSGQGRLAFSRSEKRFVAVRYVSRRFTPLLLRSYEEIAVLKRLSHPNIVKHHECLLYQTLGGTFVISEHVARGTLIDTHNLEGAKLIPENAARGFILEIIAALEYLHSLSICHADLRPDNILRAVNGTVKLNPLGAITHEFTQIQSMEKLTKARLAGKSSAFLPPEMCWKIKTKPAMPPKSYAMDVWAVGAILYFMLYGRVPFAGVNYVGGNAANGGSQEASIQDHICTGKLRFPRTPETSRNVRNLLKNVLAEKDPRTRIPLAELKMHPWFLEENKKTGTHNGSNTSGTQPVIPISPYGMQPLVVAPEEVDAAVQVAKVIIPA